MAPVRTGASIFNADSTTANTGTLSVSFTVPADATAVIVTFHGFRTAANQFSGGGVTFTKGGVDTAMTLIPNGGQSDASTACYGGAMWGMLAPDQGSTTSVVKWDWAGTAALDDATRKWTITFFKDVDAASLFRDGAGKQQAGATAVGSTGTLTAQTGDLIYVVGWGSAVGGEGSVDTWSNCTLLEQVTTGAGNMDIALATASPSGNQTVGITAVTNWQDGGIVAAVLKPLSAGSPYTMAAGTGTATLAGQAAGLNYGPWQLVGVSTSVQSTATGHTLTLPAGVQQGDLLIAMISSRIASTTSITLPSGGEWTTFAEQKTNNTLTTGSAVASGLAAYCIRGASDPNLVFTHPTAPSVALGRIVAYRGGYVGGWLDQSGSATTAVSTTSVSVTGVTTLYPGDLIVVGLCGGQEAAWSAVDATNPSVASGATDTTTNPTYNTWLERADVQTTTGSDTSLAIADAVRAAAGATGNITATASVAASHVVLIGAFRPKLVSLAPYTMAASTGTLALSGQTVVLNTALPAGLGTLTAAGQAVTLRIARKIVALTGTLTLSGQAATLSYSRKIKMAAATGTLTLAGQTVVLRAVRKLVAGLGTLTLAGQAATLKRSTVMPAGNGTLTLVGETVILTKSAAVMHYTMPADPGTLLVLGGQALALRATRKAAAGTGALTLVGQTVVPRVTLPVGTGTLTLGGQAASLRIARKVVAGTGTLTLAGQAAVLRSVRKLVAGTGTLALAGQTVVPRVALPAGTGTLTLGGQAAVLRIARKVAAGTGTLTLAGQTTVLDWSNAGVTVMPAGLGQITLGGQSAHLRYARKMAAATGTLTLGGQVVVLRPVRRLSTALGTVTLAGQPATLQRTLVGHTLSAGTGALTLAGQPAEVFWTARVDYIMTAGAGTILVTGQPTNLIKTGAYLLSAGTGSVTLAGQAAALRATHRMVAGTGAIVLSGRPVSLTLASTYTLVAATGTLALSGRPAGLVAEISGYTMQGARGTLALTGNVVSLNVNRVTQLEVQPGRLTFGRRVSVRRW